MTGRLVKDINLNGSSSPNDLIDIQGVLYFVADSGTSEKSESDGSTAGLWKSDGSDGGTVLLKSFDSASNLVEANGFLYFIAEVGGSFEIWRSDGTSEGTKRVNTLYPGSNSFSAYNLTSIEGTLFFSASGPEEDPSGYELWRWEGDNTGTKLFKNLFPDRYIRSQTIEIDEETNKKL